MTEYDLYIAGREAEATGRLNDAIYFYGKAMDMVDDKELRCLRAGIPFEDPLALRIERALGRVECRAGGELTNVWHL